MPPNIDSTPVVEDQNGLCIKCHWKIYQDAKILNEKEKMSEGNKVLRGYTSFATSKDFFSFIYLIGWVGTPGIIAKRLYGSSMPCMLPLSAGLLIRGPSLELRTLSLLVKF